MYHLFIFVTNTTITQLWTVEGNMGESLITINVTKYDYCIPVLLCGFCNCGEKEGNK